MNLLTVNLTAPSLQSAQMTLAAPVDVPSLDNATLVRDENGQLIVSGTYNGVPVWQEIHLSEYPVLIVFDPESTNFIVVTNLKNLDPSYLVLDIFPDAEYLP